MGRRLRSLIRKEFIQIRRDRWSLILLVATPLVCFILLGHARLTETGMTILLVTTLVMALGIVREKEQGTLEQIIVSPVTPLELILSKLIPYTLIGLIDFALVTSAGIYLFQLPFTGSLPVSAALAILFLLAALSLGLFISTLAQNQQQAAQMAAFALLSQLLLVGLVFPQMTATPGAIWYIVLAAYTAVMLFLAATRLGKRFG